MASVKGRRVLLTGASRGIGYEVVKLFIGEGAELIGVARDAAKLKELEGRFEGFQGVPGDIADRSLGAKLAKAVTDRWGALDMLVNNAAVQFWYSGFQAEPLQGLEQTFDVNLFSVHRLTRALLPLLKKGREPRIINVSSGVGQFNSLLGAEGATYKLSKYALNGLTVLYAADLKGQVAVNAVDPGWLKTDLGGPNAPGEAIDGARRMLQAATKPFFETGKFWHGAEEANF